MTLKYFLVPIQKTELVLQIKNSTRIFWNCPLKTSFGENRLARCSGRLAVNVLARIGHVLICAHLVLVLPAPRHILKRAEMSSGIERVPSFVLIGDDMRANSRA